MKYLREQGHVVMRTAGSHGPFDLICVEGPNCKVRFIQIKATRGTMLVNAWHTKFRAKLPMRPSTLYTQELWLFDGATKTWDRSCVI